ncbi:15602_t:CDS:1, partial [Funneliformis geosporum]
AHLDWKEKKYLDSNIKWDIGMCHQNFIDRRKKEFSIIEFNKNVGIAV